MKFLIGIFVQMYIKKIGQKKYFVLKDVKLTAI